MRRTSLMVMFAGAIASPAGAQDLADQLEPGEARDGGRAVEAPIMTSQPDQPHVLRPVTVFGELDPYFEQQNSTALKGTSDTSKIPYTTNVLNSQVIEDLKADRLEKVFEYIPGFTRSNTAANSFTIRGHSADLQNMQVDGLPGLTSRFGSPTTANIERVEVLKGPASVLYGWMDPGGMVNMVTKKPENDEFYEINVSAEAYAEYGGEGFSGSIDFNGRLNDAGTLLYRLVAGYENQDSFRDHVDDETMLYAFPSLSWVPSKDRRLDVQVEYTKENRAADDGLFVLGQDINQRAAITTYYQEPGDTDNDEGIALNIDYEDRLTDSLGLNLRWRSVWHEDERDLYESNSVLADNTLRRRNRHQFNKRQYHFGDANVDVDVDLLTEQKFTLGVGGGYEYRQFDRHAFDTTGAAVGLIAPSYTGDVLADDPDSFRTFDLYNIGVYAQDQIFLTDELTLVVAGRYDRQSGDYSLRYIDNDADPDDQSVKISTTAFNAGATYEVIEQAIVYASTSRSFNPQSIPNFDANNEQLPPEKGTQYEAGVKLSFLDDALNANLSVFHVTKDNVSETVNGAKKLVGSIESEGGELEIQYQPSANWQFQMAYTYTDAEVTETTDADAIGNRPGFVPKHAASLLARYNYPEEVLGGLVGMGLGWRVESARFTDEETSKRVRLPGYHVTDLNFYYELESLKLSLNVDNVFNEIYFDGGSNDTEVHVGDPLRVRFQAKTVF